MKTEQITKYICEKCNTSYFDEQSAVICESREVTEDKGAKIGDRVMILSGQGSGEFAKISSITIIDKDWGHYHWERYWHTIAVCADLDSFGCIHYSSPNSFIIVNCTPLSFNNLPFLSLSDNV